MSNIAINEISGCRYADSVTNHSHKILLKPTFAALDAFFSNSGRPRRLFDLVCGNGSVAALLADRGYDVCGADPSEEGIAQARAAYPGRHLEIGSAYEDLAKRYGRFPAVGSLGVIELSTRRAITPSRSMICWNPAE